LAEVGDMRASVTIARLDEFEIAFGELGAKVGPRLGTKKRTHDEKEWYVIRRFLDEAIARKLFSLPLTVEKGHPPAPDFLVRDKREAFVEITEATDEADQREMTLIELSDKWILHGELGGRFNGGGGNPGPTWASDIVKAVERKKGKSIFAPTSSERHLIIYPNSNASALIFSREDEVSAFSTLLNVINPRRSELLRITNGCLVHILGKEYVFFDVFGRATRRRRKQ
jgi:hypothetical protein